LSAPPERRFWPAAVSDRRRAIASNLIWRRGFWLGKLEFNGQSSMFRVQSSMFLS
jgi:hypothetical protein